MSRSCRYQATWLVSEAASAAAAANIGDVLRPFADLGHHSRQQRELRIWQHTPRNEQQPWYRQHIGKTIRQAFQTKEHIWLDDPSVKLAQLRSRVGMVFQHFELFPHLTVLDNLTLAQTKVPHRPMDEARDIGLRLLDRVGLKAHAQKFPAQLSGGQQQRVAIARALSMNPIAMPVRRTDIST